MKEDIIADSSFYICFLDCINSPNIITKIIKNFKVHIPLKVLEEISISKNASYILDVKELLNIFSNPYLNLGEALRPFLSEKEINKGEHEIIILAYVCNGIGIDFVLIIDEISKRKMVIKIIPELKDKLTGTLGFTGMCHYKYNIFNKTETLSLIDKISTSSFRVTPQIVAEVKTKVEQSKNE